MSALTELKKELEAVETLILESEDDLKKKVDLRRKAFDAAANAADTLQDRQDRAEKYRAAIAVLEEESDRG